MKSFIRWLGENEEIEFMIQQKGYVMFFEFEKDIYGANENSRIVFANIKSEGSDEESFSASDLEKELKGEVKIRLFNKKNVKKIKMMELKEVVEKLNSHSKSK